MAAKTQTNYESGRNDLWRVCPIEKYNVDGNETYRMGGLMQIKAKRFNSLEANIQPADYPAPKHSRPVLIVALGMGTDSVAMLVEMKRRGIRPDVVQWADTGSERLHTYRYVRVIQAWLKRNDFPPLLIVRRYCPQAGHRSLFEQLWKTEQLPSPAFHKNHSCSEAWKLVPQRAYHKFLPWITERASTAIGFSAEETDRQSASVTEAVGFSAEEKDRRSYQVSDRDGYLTHYPLMEWGMTRSDCVDAIDEAMLPQPGKSACFFCPMSKHCELTSMDREQLSAALELEQRAEDGGKLKKVRGLRKGSSQTWAEWLVDENADRRQYVGLQSDLQGEVAA